MRKKGCQSGKRHGLSKTRIYKVWNDMHARCENKNQTFYHNYGGRGISVCPEWYDFMPFYSWAQAAGYDDHLTIERLNNDGNYCPENCAFVDRFVQANNKRNNTKIDVCGELLTLPQIARKYNLTRRTLQVRYKKGMRGEALVKPSYYYQTGNPGKTADACPIAQEG